MLLGLESFSYHLAFAYKQMNVFDFIRRTAELGLAGVEILVEGANLGHLGSEDPGFLRDVRALTDELACTSNSTPANTDRGT